MKEIIILICMLVIFGYGYHAMNELSGFLMRNRRGRKNYEYYFTDEEED